MFRKFVCLFISLLIFSSVVPATCFESEAASLSFEEYLAQGIEDFNKRIDISRYVNKGGWSMDDIRHNLLNFYVSEPDCFYIDNTYNIFYGNDSYYIAFNYLYSKEEITAMQEEMDNAALKAISGIDDDMTDAQKALVVHDYIILNCKYDFSLESFTAYDCLVKGRAVCQGYTLAYIYILENYLGIECKAVVSESQNHAWNYVNIGDKWYHVDVTADDAFYTDINGESNDVFGTVMHENFLLSDSGIKKSSGLHRDWRIIGKCPAAADKAYDDFYWREITSQIIEYKGLWYFCSGYGNALTGDLYSGFYSYNPSSGKTKRIKSIDTSWYPVRNQLTGNTYEYGTVWYKSSFSKVLLIDGKFYISSAKRIFRYDPGTGKMKKVFTLNKGENQQIFSIMQKGSRKIRICYKPDLSYSDNYLTLRLK